MLATMAPPVDLLPGASTTLEEVGWETSVRWRTRSATRCCRR